MEKIIEKIIEIADNVIMENTPIPPDHQAIQKTLKELLERKLQLFNNNQTPTIEDIYLIIEAIDETIEILDIEINNPECKEAIASGEVDEFEATPLYGEITFNLEEKLNHLFESEKEINYGQL